jgi:hypothetical protein
MAVINRTLRFEDLGHTSDWEKESIRFVLCKFLYRILCPRVKM